MCKFLAYKTIEVETKPSLQGFEASFVRSTNTKQQKTLKCFYLEKFKTESGSRSAQVDIESVS